MVIISWPSSITNYIASANSELCCFIYTKMASSPCLLSISYSCFPIFMKFVENVYGNNISTKFDNQPIRVRLSHFRVMTLYLNINGKFTKSSYYGRVMLRHADNLKTKTRKHSMLIVCYALFCVFPVVLCFVRVIYS